MVYEKNLVESLEVLETGETYEPDYDTQIK